MLIQSKKGLPVLEKIVGHSINFAAGLGLGYSLQQGHIQFNDIGEGLEEISGFEEITIIPAANILQVVARDLYISARKKKTIEYPINTIKNIGVLNAGIFLGYMAGYVKDTNLLNN